MCAPEFSVNSVTFPLDYSYLEFKKNLKRSDNSSSITALSSTASKAGNMGQRWKYFTWHLTSVETNAKHDLVSSRLAPAGACIQINGLPSQQMSQENLARRHLILNEGFHLDSISVRRFLPIAWEILLGNEIKQT